MYFDMSIILIMDHRNVVNNFYIGVTIFSTGANTEKGNDPIKQLENAAKDTNGMDGN